MPEDDNPTGEATAPSERMNFALDIIDTLREHRITLTEIEPTDTMVAAGMAASGAGAELVRAVFKAMLLAGGNPASRVQ